MIIATYLQDELTIRARVTPVANLKIKNNLLTITLVLTSLPGSVKVSRAVVEQVGYVIGQYLGAGVERPEVSSIYSSTDS